MTILDAVYKLNGRSSSVNMTFSQFEQDKARYVAAGTWNWLLDFVLFNVVFVVRPEINRVVVTYI